MLESLFNKEIKETPRQMFSCEICEIFNNIFFIEHLRWLLLFRDVFRTLLNIYDGAFCESCQRVLAVNFFRKKAVS